MRPGVLYVMDSGQDLMHKWPADSWDIQEMVLQSSTMPTLDKVLALSSWMTYSALDERQDLLTVQRVSAKELRLMTSAVATLMMLD